MYETVNIIRREFAKSGLGVIASGNSPIIPGLYAADKSYIVPSVNDDDYIPRLLEICVLERVKAVLTFLDRDILVIASKAEEFSRIGVIPLVPDFEVAQICDNKYSMYQFLMQHGFKCAKTYGTLENFRLALDKGEITFPVFIKPIIGDGSRGAVQCMDMNELLFYYSKNSNIIIQEFMEGPEYDIDVYIDTISRNMVSIFAKEKLAKMIGGTDKALSVKDEEMFTLVDRISQSLGITGPIDIELFSVDGEYYIGEVNPRFGASYICAYSCGVDFCSLIANNINGIENPVSIGNYKAGILMMKYDQVLIKNCT